MYYLKLERINKSKWTYRKPIEDLPTKFSARIVDKVEPSSDTDSEAAESAEALFRMVQGTPMAVTVGRMTTALSAYDFETAMSELASLKPAT